MGLLTWLWDRVKDYEPEHTEPVAHDCVIVEGKELTADDTEKGQ